MPKADGTVAIQVDMNTSKAEKELAKLKQKIDKTEATLNEQKNKRAPMLAQLEELDKKAEASASTIKKLKDQLEDLEQNRGEADLVNEKAEAVAELNAIEKNIAEMQVKFRSSLAGLSDTERAEASKAASSMFQEAWDKETAAKERLAAAERALIEYQEQRKQAMPQIVEQIEKEEKSYTAVNDEITKISPKVEEYNNRIRASEELLQSQREEAGQLADEITRANSASAKMGDAAGEIQAGFEKLNNRLSGLVKRVFVFSLFTSALRSMRTWLGKVVSANEEASQALANLKGSLIAMVAPLARVVIPAFVYFVNLLTKILQIIGTVTAKVFGSTYDQSVKTAEGLYEQQEALEGVGGAAKDASKSMASFDEINQLAGDNASGGGVGGGGAAAPDFKGMVNDGNDGIVGLISGLALLALGAIITFSGASIPVGLAMMVAGAMLVYGSIEEDWGGISKKLNDDGIGAVLLVLSGALLAIGAILLFSGANIPLGLGLIVVGAVGLGTTASAKWEWLSEKIGGIKNTIFLVLSGALLVIGGILLFSGTNIPLGLGMIAVGAFGLGGVAAANWEWLAPKLQGVTGTILLVLSGALLVIGAILAFSGAATPLGLGLMALGAVGLGTTITANWEWLVEKLGGTKNAIFALISGALLVLGVIMVFSGVAMGIGFGLIASGIYGLGVTTNEPFWDALFTQLKEAWNKVGQWWESDVKEWFTAEKWREIGARVLEGLFSGMSNIKDFIAKWGSKIIGGVKDLFGIHSPSTEAADWGKYIILGFQNELVSESPMVVMAFDAMLNQMVSGNNTATATMKASLAALLAYITIEFVSQWAASWTNAEKSTSTSVSIIKKEIDSLNAKLASIERNITIRITTIQSTTSGSGDLFSQVKTKSRAVQVPSIASTDIPHLAQGAVIPANREFMAVLGDQKSGANVEAPAALIKQMVTEALREAGFGRDGGEQTVNLYIDREQFGKAVYRANRRESRRIGLSLVEE